VFDKIQKDKINSFYSELFKQIINEYKDRIKQEFVNLKIEEDNGNVDPKMFTRIQQIHSKIFDIVVIDSLQSC